MRTFCLILILCNVLFLSWSQLLDDRVRDLERAPPTAVAPPPRLVLAREVPPTQEPRANPVQPPRVAPLSSSTPSEAEADAMTCSSVGPFADLTEASQAQAH
jgi:hypothetical protein